MLSLVSPIPNDFRFVYKRGADPVDMPMPNILRRPCLVSKNSQDYPLHQILRHMYETLNNFRELNKALW